MSQKHRWSIQARLACALILAWGFGLALSSAGRLYLTAHGAADAWNLDRATMFGVGAAGAIVSGFCLHLLRGFEKDRIWYLVLFGVLCSAVATPVMLLLPQAASYDAFAASPAGKGLEHHYKDLLHTAAAGQGHAHVVLNILLATFLYVVVTMLLVLGGLVLVFGFPTWLWVVTTTDDEKYPQARTAVTAAFATTMLQVGFWVLLIPLLGMAALLYMYPDANNTTLFSRVWTRFAFNLCLAGLVIAPALAVTYNRWRLARPFFARGRAITSPPNVPRLIAHKAILVGLFLASLIGQAAFVHAAWADSDWLNELLGGYQWYFVGGGLFVLAVAFLVGREGLLIGLHILRDIVGHFYRTGVLADDTFRPVRDLAAMTTKQFADLFPVEEELEHRFRYVLKEVLRRLPVTHLVVVAHSQGTIVTVHGLNSPETRQILSGGGVREVRLVTMGSSLTHLYRHYFPHRYQSLKDNAGNINPVHWVELRNVVTCWRNLFRIDDFVGTEIEGPKWFPDNRWVYGRGHVGYWTDPEALGVLRDLLPGG